MFGHSLNVLCCFTLPWVSLCLKFSSVTQSCLTVCDSIDCSTPGFPVHDQLLEFTQTHVHWVCNAIQPSHPLLSPSPSAFKLSQHQGLFKWVSYLHQVAKVLVFQLQHQNIHQEYSGLISFRMDWFDLLAVQGTLKIFSNTTDQKLQFFGAQLPLWSNSSSRYYINEWMKLICFFLFFIFISMCLIFIILFINTGYWFIWTVQSQNYLLPQTLINLSHYQNYHEI